MTQDEFLMEFYKEENAHARHTEVQRLEVTKFLLVAAAALLSVMGTLKFSVYCVPLAIGLIYLGRFGEKMLAVYASRFTDHRDRARAARAVVDAAVGNGGLQKIISAHPIDKSVGRVREFWGTLNRALVTFGIICLCWIVVQSVTRAALDSQSFWHALAGQFAVAP